MFSHVFIREIRQGTPQESKVAPDENHGVISRGAEVVTSTRACPPPSRLPHVPGPPKAEVLLVNPSISLLGSCRFGRGLLSPLFVTTAKRQSEESVSFM